MDSEKLLGVGGDAREPVRLTGFTYRVSEEALAKMMARDESRRRAAIYYKDIMFR